jgi:hypothetical protein
MQQFARRPDPEGQEPAPQLQLSPDSSAELLDHVTELRKQLATAKEELTAAQAENTKLRLQIAGGAAEHAAAASKPSFAPEAPVQKPEAPKVETPTAPKPEATKKPESEKTAQEKIDEEFLVDLVRAQGVKETTSPKKDDVIDTVLAIEESAAGPMSDDDIQRMLAEAALGAFDAAAPEAAQHAVDAMTTDHETEGPDNRPFLHIEESDEAPVVEAAPVIEPFTLDLAVTAKVPSHLAIAALAVPHRLEGTKLYCKSVLPFDYPSLDVMADAVACEVVPEPAHMEDVLAALRKAYGEENAPIEKDYAWNVSQSQPKRKRGLFRRSA